MLAAVNASPLIPPSASHTSPSSSSAAGGNRQKSIAGPKGSVVGSSTVVEERAQEGDGDGWLEVGKKNRMVVTRTVCLHFVVHFVLSFLPWLSCSCPSFFTSILYFILLRSECTSEYVF